MAFFFRQSRRELPCGMRAPDGYGVRLKERHSGVFFPFGGPRPAVMGAMAERHGWLRRVPQCLSPIPRKAVTRPEKRPAAIPNPGVSSVGFPLQPSAPKTCPPARGVRFWRQRE